METQTLDPKAIRVKIAESGILHTQFAEMAGLRLQNLSNIMYGRETAGPVVSARILAAFEELERNPRERQRKPRGRKRAEQLRAEQLASGCEQSVRYL